jgi:hypothetical protein
MKMNSALDHWLTANPCPKTLFDPPRWIFKACLVALHHGLPIHSDTARTIAEKCPFEFTELEVLSLLSVAEAVRHESDYFGEYLKPSNEGGRQ